MVDLIFSRTCGTSIFFRNPSGWRTTPGQTLEAIIIRIMTFFSLDPAVSSPAEKAQQHA